MGEAAAGGASSLDARRLRAATAPRRSTRSSGVVGRFRLVIGDLEIDTATREVRRAGQPITLKPREYALLEYLALRRGEVVSRRDIETHLYDEAVDPMSNVIDSAISVLRKRLAQSGAPSLIHTRHGHGYVLKSEGG